MKSFGISTLHIDKAWDVLKRIKFINYKNFFILFFYYIFTIINTFMEGVGLVLIVELFTNYSSNSIFVPSNSISEYVSYFLNLAGISISFKSIIVCVLFLFSLRLITYGSILLSDAFIIANTRKAIQEALFSNFIKADWRHMNNQQIGNSVNINTTEAMTLAKYYLSSIKAIYFFFTTFFLMLIAFLIDTTITITLCAISMPLILMLNYILKLQAINSLKYAEQRNIFASDITERLSGLIQIKGENSENFHINKGNNAQKLMKKYEIFVGYSQAAANLFVILFPLAVLIYLTIYFAGDNVQQSNFLALFASIGVIGVRAMTQFNGLVGSIAVMTQQSGSLQLIRKAFKIKQMFKREKIKEKINSIDIENICFSYDGRKILENFSLSINNGKILLLKGESGSGKSTLANLISGILIPDSGYIKYKSIKNNIYASTKYQMRVGYVTQDVHLFRGTVRENLISDQIIDDRKINNVLEKVGAKNFIDNLGGLNGELKEMGRSLSGGQKRRIGIARALLLDANLLILDEITAGLDNENVKKINTMIEELSSDLMIIMISHEDYKPIGSEIINL